MARPRGVGRSSYGFAIATGQRLEGRSMNTGRRIAAVVFAAACAGGCDEGPTAPSSSAIATFRVANEQFRVRLTSREQVAAARAASEGGRASIPNGRIVAGAQVNEPWSWHLEDVAFAEVTTEVCDGRPSDVEREGTGFGGGRFCPWDASIVDLDEQ
jgi:hypothetical protein